MQEVGLTHSTEEAGNDRRGKGLACSRLWVEGIITQRGEK